MCTLNAHGCLYSHYISMCLHLRVYRYNRILLTNQCIAQTKISTKEANCHPVKCLISHVIILNDYKGKHYALKYPGYH